MSYDKLAVGAVIKLNNVDDEKFLVAGKVPLVEQNDMQVYFDYQLFILPNGAAADRVFFANSDDISEVLYAGFVDEESKAFQEGVSEWIADTDIPKGKTKKNKELK